MKLLVNGEATDVEQSANIGALLEALGYSGDFIAVALNGVAIPRQEYAATPVRDRDEIEILSPMQGG